MIGLDVGSGAGSPGWIPFLVVLGLALAIVGLYFSMRKQFRKINIPPPDEQYPNPPSSGGPGPQR